MAKITVVKVDPGKEPESVEIENDLKAKQALVDGYVEGHQIPGTLFMLFVNEDGRMKGLPYNRRLNNVGFRGTMVLAKVQGPDSVTMTEDDIKKAKELLS